MIKFEPEVFELHEQMELSKKDKQSFINFINYLEIPQVKPWVSGWLEQHWTDEMNQVFFDKYWSGSFDVETLYVDGIELRGLIDDIEECAGEMRMPS